MSKRLDGLVHSRYASAVAQGALLFTESTIHSHRERDVLFMIRLVPALAKKPSSKPKENQRARDFVNPFLPYDDRLHVAQLGASHHLLLNKYCVVPYHLLITTARFHQQGEPLDATDFAAVLDTINGLSTSQIVFYNSGEESGASQPHKHLQLLPMPASLDLVPSTDLWLKSNPPLGRVYTSDHLPFAHFGVRLAERHLEPAALTTVYLAALRELTSAYGSGVSYNMVLTRPALLLFPRCQSSWCGISINSLGFAGLVLCKTKEEQDLLDNVGVLRLLTHVGFPRIPEANDGHSLPVSGTRDQ
ncbi:bifunctional AP-4-A phosphorylase/ADP sulfurylase [Coemansia sp. RSA 1365]|nr:bifunctional AP-4-A phosphorylase/ADP sulfurylase [Coemansia sp. RSA 1365]